MRMRTLFRLLFATLAFDIPQFAASGPEASAALTSAIAMLNREASLDAEGPTRLADLIQKEYGTREEELQWAEKQSLKWGEIAAMAYIQATTGKSFAEM